MYDWQIEMREKRKLKNKTLILIASHKCYCYLCGKEIVNPEDFNIDHVFPKCKGGKILKPTHHWCNTEKGCMLIEDWIFFKYNIDIRDLK